MRKITKAEINQLFDFTQKHYVEFYDVQVELVDHLANAIEAQWTENPEISFEEALQIEFKKFGVFGFTSLVEQKQRELIKYYNKMFLNEVLKFVSIPKAILTAVLYMCIYFFLTKTGSLGEVIALVLLLGSFIYFMIDGFRYIYKIKREQQKKSRSWLIQSVAKTTFTIPNIGLGGAYYSIVNNMFENNLGISNIGIHFLTFFLVFHIIFMFVFYKVLKPSLNKSIQETEQKYRLV